MRATLVEYVVFDDDLSRRVKIQGKLFQQSRILICAFTMNDIRQENDVVDSRNQLAPIISGNQIDSSQQVGFANVAFGESQGTG